MCEKRGFFRLFSFGGRFSERKIEAHILKGGWAHTHTHQKTHRFLFFSRSKLHFYYDSCFCVCVFHMLFLLLIFKLYSDAHFRLYVIDFGSVLHTNVLKLNPFVFLLFLRCSFFFSFKLFTV